MAAAADGVADDAAKRVDVWNPLSACSLQAWAFSMWIVNAGRIHKYVFPRVRAISTRTRIKKTAPFRRKTTA